MLDFIKNEIHPDLVLWGGNSVPHALDTLTNQQVIDTMKRVTEQITDALGEDSQIVATLGGHDIFPENYYVPVKDSSEVFKNYRNTWDLFIDYGSRKTFKEFGYYS
jgi:hypothetical protein